MPTAVVVVLGVLGGLFVPDAAHAKVFCPKVQVFSAVGSGNRGDPDVTDVLRDEILRPERERAKPDSDLFHAWRVDYPAVSVISHTGVRAVTKTGGAYHKSVVAGKKWLREHIKTKIDNCWPGTLIILAGYSQGAQVVADVYQELERSGRAGRIFGLALFGDPYFNPKNPDGRGSSQGKWRHTNRSGSLGRRPEYGRYSLRVRSYCHKHDPVCQDGRLSLSDHSNYGKTGPGEPGEATDAGRWLSTRIRNKWKTARPGGLTAPWTFDPDGYGPIRIGMTRQDAERLLGKSLTTSGLGVCWSPEGESRPTSPFYVIGFDDIITSIVYYNGLPGAEGPSTSAGLRMQDPLTRAFALYGDRITDTGNRVSQFIAARVTSPGSSNVLGIQIHGADDETVAGFVAGTVSEEYCA